MCREGVRGIVGRVALGRCLVIFCGGMLGGVEICLCVAVPVFFSCSV